MFDRDDVKLEPYIQSIKNMMAIIAELRAEVEALRAREVWEAWEDDDLSFTCGAATIGQIGNQMYVEVYGETLQVDMPDDIRLCRQAYNDDREPIAPGDYHYYSPQDPPVGPSPLDNF